MGRLKGKQVGNYTLTSKLGEGGFGEVWRAEHGLTGDEVAVKVLFASSEASLVDGLKKEALLMHRLSKQWASVRRGVQPPQPYAPSERQII